MNSFYRLVSKLVNKLFGKKLQAVIKEDLVYAQDNLFTYNQAPFLDDPKFTKAYTKGKATDKDRFLKGVDLEWRIHTLCWAAEYAQHLQGDFLEFGVRTGFFSSSIIDYTSFAYQERQFILIDSFCGVIPDLLSEDEFSRERHGIKPDQLWDEVYQDVIDQYAMIDNVKVIKGVVPEVLERLELDKVAFVSLDLNSALPEKAVLDFIWDKLVPGGIIVLDDYGYTGFEEQQKVHDEFAQTHGTSVFCLPTCQGLIIKPQINTPQ